MTSKKYPADDQLCSHRSKKKNFFPSRLNSLDSHADALPERLSERFRFAHFQREDLTAGNAGKRRVGAERLGHTWQKQNKEILYISFCFIIQRIYLIELYDATRGSRHSNRMRLLWQLMENLFNGRPSCHGNSPIAMAVFPVPGWPAIRQARPAILPS